MTNREKVIEDAFDEFLNGSYKPVTILNPGDPYDQTGISLYPAEILKNTDPIAYRSFMNDWADRFNLDDEDETDTEDTEDESYKDEDY